MPMLQSRVEFLTLLAFTQVECGRYGDAVDLLKAIRLMDPQNIEASRLLALAQLRQGDALACLKTVERHQRQFGLEDKRRQMTWLKIRGLHGSGQVHLSRQLLDQLCSDIRDETEPSC